MEIYLTIAHVYYMKLREACERSGLHPHTIRKYADTGAIPSVRPLVDASGLVGLAQTFDLYVNGHAKTGSAQSALGLHR